VNPVCRLPQSAFHLPHPSSDAECAVARGPIANATGEGHIATRKQCIVHNLCSFA